MLATLVLWRGKSPAEAAGRAALRFPPDRRRLRRTASISSLQQQIRANPKDFDAHIKLANAYLQKVRETGDPTLYTKAEDLLDEAQKLEPQSPELFATRGTLALARHDFAAALGYGHAGPWPPTPRAPATTASSATPRSNWACTTRPSASYQEMVDSRPDFASFSRVAYARELYGDPEGAIEAMEFALQAGSGTPENVAWAHVQLGNLWFGSGNLDEAEKQYGRSTETVSAYAPALAGQARVAAARGEPRAGGHALQTGLQPHAPPRVRHRPRRRLRGNGRQPRRPQAQYELVQSMDELLRANGVNTDLEIALFYADHDMDLKTSLEKARSAYEARPSIHAADALAWTLYKTGTTRRHRSTPRRP